jgi:hypothetical protein
MPYYVCKGAVLKCSMGTSPSVLNIIPTGKPVYLHNRLMAKVTDHKPNVNVQSFGLCRSMANPTVAAATSANFGVLTPMPCIPNTQTPWNPPKNDVLINNKSGILDNCKLNCVWAGLISISNTGQ